MKRIKLFFIVIGLIFSVQSFAQVKFGIKAGGNACNMRFDIDNDYGEAPETKDKVGFHIGLITDIPLLENTLSLQPGLLFSHKGYGIDMEKILDDGFEIIDVEMNDYEGYARMSYNYIELPINIVYKNSGFQVFAGPYFAVGIGGSFKHDFSLEVAGESIDSDDFFDERSYKLKPVFGKVDDDMYEKYSDDDVFRLYRAFDFGLNLGVGYQVKSILFNVGYSLGLNNLTPRYDADYYDRNEDYTENVIQNNEVFTLSVSYFL